MPKPSRRFVVSVVASLLAATRVESQSPAGVPAPAATGVAVVDSAAVARAAWAAAGRLMRANDAEGARRQVERAATAWPLQPAYRYGQALLAARGRDTAALRAALIGYASLGLGRDLRADTNVAPFLGAPGFADLVARHDRNRRALPRSTIRATLPDSTFWPEGIDADPRTGRVYVTSVRHGTIAELTGGRVTRELLPRDGRDVGAVFAVRVDTGRGALWASASWLEQAEGYHPGDSAVAQLLRIRLSDGAVEQRFRIPGAMRHALGDVALTPSGEVIATDSRDPALYILRAGADTLIRLTHPLFRSLQGVAPHPRQRVAYVADYAHGLLRLDLETLEVSWLGAADGVTPLGLDGIVFHEGAIIAIQNGFSPPRVVRFELDTTGTRLARATLLDQNTAVADEPTIGTVIGNDFVYVANSQWAKYDDAGTRKPGARLTAPVLVAIPLGK